MVILEPSMDEQAISAFHCPTAKHGDRELSLIEGSQITQPWTLPLNVHGTWAATKVPKGKFSVESRSEAARLGIPWLDEGPSMEPLPWRESPWLLGGAYSVEGSSITVEPKSSELVRAGGSLPREAGRTFKLNRSYYMMVPFLLVLDADAEYGLDTSEFTYNPSESNRYQQTAAQPAEEKSRCIIM
ncbi:hypothetical protein Acr_14g0005230 [Actinidia rufa]|uniref:Uncharacterized protein n=1 Tax=Actinidia rufa TaxID=165716 RepID=A0A7J0FSG7_9ERIC|nr:hypothetical protein Acr_14g0005230 [Actinidia rufa]